MKSRKPCVALPGSHRLSRDTSPSAFSMSPLAIQSTAFASNSGSGPCGPNWRGPPSSSDRWPVPMIATLRSLGQDSTISLIAWPSCTVQLGQAIREIVESWPSDLRVAIIGTGHLSLELGGPRQFGPHGPDPEFDAKAVDWIANGDIEKALGEVSLDSLWEPGNATHGFLDFMLMMGTAGAGVKADYVDSLDLFHTMEAYFTWYPNGVGK